MVHRTKRALTQLRPRWLPRWGSRTPGANTVRTVSQARWQAVGAELFFDIQAEAFLYRMVRGLVGALKQVGAGTLTVDDLVVRLQARDRAQCPPLAPARGLCLIEVLY